MFCIRCCLCPLDYLDSLVGCFVDFKTVEVRTWLNSIYTISNDQRPHSKTSLLRRRLASSQHHVLIINTLVSWLWNNNFECRCDISMVYFASNRSDFVFTLQTVYNFPASHEWASNYEFEDGIGRKLVSFNQHFSIIPVFQHKGFMIVQWLPDSIETLKYIDCKVCLQSISEMMRYRHNRSL